jgi:hypothetical protein
MVAIRGFLEPLWGTHTAHVAARCGSRKSINEHLGALCVLMGLSSRDEDRPISVISVASIRSSRPGG